MHAIKMLLFDVTEYQKKIASWKTNIAIAAIYRAAYKCNVTLFLPLIRLVFANSTQKLIIYIDDKGRKPYYIIHNNIKTVRASNKQELSENAYVYLLTSFE